MNKKLKSIFMILIWLMIWQAVAMLFHQPLFLPYPISVLKYLADILSDTNSYFRIFFSLSKILLGFFMGAFLGIIFGLLSNKRSNFKLFIEPLITVVKTVPVASFIVLALFWFSSKNLSIFISFLMSFPIFYINFLQGIDNIDKKLEEMAKIFNVSPIIKFRCITLSEIAPHLLSAIKTAFGLCWKAGIAAEVIALSTNSIGEKIYQSKIYFDSVSLFSWTILIIICSLILEKLLIFIFEHTKKTITDLEKLGYHSVEKIKNPPETIHIKNLSKSFGDNVIFENLNLEIPAEKTTAITGISGIGKTTLLRILCGLENPDTGSINSQSLNFSIMFQEPRFVESISVLSNLRMVSKKSNKELIEDLKSLNLYNIEHVTVSTLSGGMKQRLSLVRSLSTDYDVLLLDEPFKEVDLETKNAMLEFLKNKINGKTVIIVTHDINEAETLGASSFIDLNSIS